MKSKRWFQLVLGVFLAMASNGFSQHGANWRVYKAADGLPETPVTSVAVGPHGHLWVRHPSVEWIGWLDGYEIKAIPSLGLGAGRVYEGPSGQIWTYTSEGLQQYQSKEARWIHYAIPQIAGELPKISSGVTRPPSLHPFKLDHVLLLTPESLIDFDTDTPQHPEVIRLHTASQSGLRKFSSMAGSRDGGLWITGATGLAKVPGPVRNVKPETEWQEYLLPGQLRIHNLREPVEDDAGGVTALAESVDGSQQVVAYFDGADWSIRPLRGEKITQAWRSGDGTFWATSFYSLLKLSPGQKQFVLNDEATQNRYFDFAAESNGVFWLATSDGLLRYAPLTWRAPPDSGELGQEQILAVNETQAGRLWVTSATALYLLQDDKWTSYPLPQEQELKTTARESSPSFILGNGCLVMETGGRLLVFDPQTGLFHYSSDSLTTRVRPLGVLSDGHLGVQLMDANAANGVARLASFDGTNFGSFPYPQPGFGPSDEALSLFVSQNGNLWLNLKEGLVWFHDNKWQRFASPAQTVPETAVCLLEVGEGRIWCAVQDRILEFDGRTWTTIRAGFYRINGMCRGSDGSIWIASENGLHRFFRKAWTINGVEEGLPSGAVREVWEDRRGRVWAGTSRGLCLYHPDADPDPPRTYVQPLEANNTVPEGQMVTITFSGQDKWKYTSEDRLVYSYELDGQEWSPYQEQRKESFFDLTAGKHSFRVRCMDRNWNVDPTPALLQFTVAPPWYRESRLMFISCLGTGVAVFFAGLAFNRHRQLLRSYAEVEAKVALRTQQLERANQELFHSQKMNALGTLAAGIAHDFNNILSIIKGSAQIIEDNLDNQSKIRTRADRIKTVVEQGAGIVKAMLGFSRSSDRHLVLCDVNSVVRETITLLGDRFLREVEVQFTASLPAPPEVPASKDFIQQILLNFIFNAAEAATGQRQVILSTKISRDLPLLLALKPAAADSYLFVAVRDFGSGIAPEVMPRIFEPFFTTKSMSTRRGTGLGLSMAYELARQMDCGLGVESAVGRGSTFTLIIPVRDLPAEPKPTTQKPTTNP